MRLSPLLLAALLPLLPACAPVIATGVGTGVLMAEDRRTAGTYVEDEGIELKAARRIDDSLKDAAHVNVTSYNRTVLLTGEVPSEEAKARAEQIARSVPNVAGIHNELAVAGVSSLTARASDSVITSKVKARFVDAGKFSPNHVKVVTEAGTVYLMGLVTATEAQNAVEVARTTSGVRRVVKIFEYIK